MVKLTLIALLFTGILAYPCAGVLTPAEIHFEEELKNNTVLAKRLEDLKCRPGFEKIPFAVKEKLQECRKNHPKPEGTPMEKECLCTKLCVMNGLGIIDDKENIDHEKLKVLTKEMYSDDKSVQAKMDDFTACHKEHKPIIHKADYAKCDDIKPFHECLKKKTEDSCKGHSPPVAPPPPGTIPPIGGSIVVPKL